MRMIENLNNIINKTLRRPTMNCQAKMTKNFKILTSNK